MTRSEYDQWFARAMAFFAPIRRMFDRETDAQRIHLHGAWQTVLKYETFTDCILALDEIVAGRLVVPEFGDEWWRFAYIVKQFALKQRENRNQQQQTEKHRTEYADARRSNTSGEQTSIQAGVKKRMESLGCAEIYDRACELMKQGMNSRDACNRAAEELKVPWWEGCD